MSNKNDAQAQRLVYITAQTTVCYQLVNAGAGKEEIAGDAAIVTIAALAKGFMTFFAERSR